MSIAAKDRDRRHLAALYALLYVIETEGDEAVEPWWDEDMEALEIEAHLLHFQPEKYDERKLLLECTSTLV